jgi:hypothetical protein
MRMNDPRIVSRTEWLLARTALLPQGEGIHSSARWAAPVDAVGCPPRCGARSRPSNASMKPTEKKPLSPTQRGRREAQASLRPLQQGQAARGLGCHRPEDLGVEADEDAVPILHEGIDRVAGEAP